MNDDDAHSHQNGMIGRRKFWRNSATIILTPIAISTVSTSSSFAANLPKAPIETLLPAARVKVNIEKANGIAEELRIGLLSNTTTTTTTTEFANTEEYKSLVDQLKAICLLRQNYTGRLELQGVPAKPADQYLNAYKPMKGDLPFQRFLIQNGDVGTWKGLKQKEKDQERENEIRAAFNAYTDALSFSSDTYLLNVDKATRSNMVREDRLPDVTQVITSDMGVRYLYRNQVLTAMDELSAEMKYVDSNPQQVVDVEEIVRLAKLAQTACTKWFSLIDPQDVDEAILRVLNQQ